MSYSDIVKMLLKNYKSNFTFQVKWVKDDIDGYLNFYSISGDGRVLNWTIVKTSMWATDILSITFAKHLENLDEGAHILKGLFCISLCYRVAEHLLVLYEV